MSYSSAVLGSCFAVHGNTAFLPDCEAAERPRWRVALSSIPTTTANLALLDMKRRLDFRFVGPAEQAGEAVDNAMEKAGKAIEKVGDNLQDAAQGDKR